MSEFNFELNVDGLSTGIFKIIILIQDIVIIIIQINIYAVIDFTIQKWIVRRFTITLIPEILYIKFDLISSGNVIRLNKEKISLL